jgi:outer membrane biosynthesis protein TonB
VLVSLVVVVLLLSSSAISNAPPECVETSEHARVTAKNGAELTPAKSEEHLPPPPTTVVVVDKAKEEPTLVKKDTTKIVELPQNEVVTPKKIQKDLEDKTGNLQGKELFKDPGDTKPHGLHTVNIVSGGLLNGHSTIYFHKF